MRCSPRYCAFAFILATLSLGLFSSTAAAQTYFYNRADFATGNYPKGVAFADFNGDGRLDLAIINFQDNTVSILLGKPDGTFAPKNDIPVAIAPEAVAVGDFNGDGKMDLAITSGGNTVSILLGNGDGTFQASGAYPTGNLPLGLTVTDFNHDGKADLAVTNTNCSGITCSPGSVSILLGNGDGTFQAKTDYALPASPGSVIAADFNGDGNLDLAVTSTNFSGSYNGSLWFVSILLGNGDGTFQPHVDYPTGYATSGVAAADFNGDGKLDLVLAAQYPQLFLGNGDGTFQAGQQIPITTPGGMGSYGVLAADLNRDGKMDFVIANVDVYGISVFLGNGDGTFQPEADYMASLGQGAMAMGDVNGDGALDVVLTDWSGGALGGNTANVLLGNGDGTFSPRVALPSLPPVQLSYPPYSYGYYAVGGFIGDFNGDGKLDLLVMEAASSYGAEVAVFPGNGDGTFGPPAINDIAYGVFAVADFTGDGKLDLILNTSYGAGIALGNGDGTFGSSTPFMTVGDPAIESAVTGDFNNDGKTDVVIMANGFITSPPLYMFLGNGDGTFRGLPPFWSGSQIPNGMVAADFNRDGNLDLAVTLNTSDTNRMAVMLGNGDGTFRAPVFYPTDQLPNGIAVADFNGDGIPDLVVTGNSANVYLGNGDGTFKAPV